MPARAVNSRVLPRVPPVDYFVFHSMTGDN
jgi:hypothetical protein